MNDKPSSDFVFCQENYINWANFSIEIYECFIVINYGPKAEMTRLKLIQFNSFKE